MTLNLTPKEKTVEGAIAVRFLIKMHRAKLVDTFFWLNRYFNNYEDKNGEVKSPDYNHRLSEYNPYSYFFKIDELLKFMPNIYQQIISTEDLTFKRYDPAVRSFPEYFKDYEEDEISHIIEHNIGNNNLFAINGSEFCMHYSSNDQQFLLKGEIEAIEKQYEHSLMNISNQFDTFLN
jgi:hypothetical protein